MKLVLDLWIRCPSSSFQLVLLAVLLLLTWQPFFSSCWPAPPSFSSAPGASLGDPSHCLLLLGSCDDVLEQLQVFLRFLVVYAHGCVCAGEWNGECCELASPWFCVWCLVTVVLTAHNCMLCVCCLSGSHSCACGKVGFLLPPEQAAAVDLYPLVGLYFWYCQLYYSHMAFW
jgi:hypothetical protein